MKKSDVVDLLKEQAQRAANRHKRSRRFLYLLLSVFIFGIGVYSVKNIPEQNFMKLMSMIKLAN